VKLVAGRLPSPGVKVTARLAMPAVAATLVGVPGTMAGVTVAGGALGAELPLAAAPLATTVIVYWLPLTSPKMVHVVVLPFGVTQVIPPGEAVAV
jgi:hypothetical protein